MQNPIELKGYWWLPNQEENKLPGILTFSQEEGAWLAIAGILKTEKTDPIEEPTIILGLTQQGKPITLYKCIIHTWTDQLIGFRSGESKYRAHFVFEGVCFDSEEKIKFHELYGSYTDLDAWVGIYGFTIEQDNIDGKFFSKVRYEKPVSQFFDISNAFEVGIGFSSHGPNQSIIQTEIKISQRAYLVVKSKNGDISFDSLSTQLDMFSSLLQVAVQRIPYPISVSGFSQESSQERDGKKVYYPEINIYYQPIESRLSRREKLPQEFLFTFSDLASEQITSWFASFDKYKTIIYLYRSLFYSNRLFIDAKFLNIAQALESLHSILFGSQYLPHDKFVEQKDRALQNVPNDLIEWVRTALNNANYIPFKSRILELLTNKKVLLGQFIDDMDLFAKRVRDTRNEFVHHGKLRWTFQHGEELVSAINLLTMLFEAYLLEVIGFSDEKVQELLEPKIQTHLTGWKHLRSIKK